MSRLVTIVAAMQGTYYLAFGIWPLISIETFQAVSGAKTDHLVTGREGDHWLVNTVGALIAVIGVVLIVSARRRIAAETVLLGLLSALVLATIDFVYVWRETIARIYLADAAIEAALAAGWVAGLIARNRREMPAAE